MQSLVDIMRDECLPRGSCMLTVFDPNGESGFLYFKDGQLIEVNTGKYWAKDAFGRILRWHLQSHQITELPRGIKRSLWEPVDKLIEEVAGSGSASGIRDAAAVQGGPQVPVIVVPDDPVNDMIKELTDVPGFLAVMRQMPDGSHFTVAGQVPLAVISPEWLEQYAERVAELGGAMGAGIAISWFAELESCRIWRLRLNQGGVILFTDLDALPDDVEQRLKELVGRES